MPPGQGPPGPAQEPPRRASLAFLAAAWLLAVGGGFVALWRYELTPGPTEGRAARWPVDSRLLRHPSLPTLVMAAHARCPCTRASLGELAVLMARAAGRIHAYVLVSDLGTGPSDGVGSPLWRQAAAIPGLHVVRDPAAREAGRFGAAVSGETLLFAPDGRLLFAGGITAARGHSGDNEGRTRILALLESPDTAFLPTTAAFGCGLFADPASARRNDDVARPR